MREQDETGNTNPPKGSRTLNEYPYLIILPDIAQKE